MTKDELLKPHEWKGNLDLLNIVMIGITNEIPERDKEYELHRLIATLLSSELKEHEKLKIIEQEYNIPNDLTFCTGRQSAASLLCKKIGHKSMWH